MKEETSLGTSSALPRAGLRRKKGLLWPTLVIVLLVGLVGGFVVYDYMKQGERITVWFTDLHGIRVGSPLEHQGDQIGEVVEIGRPDDLSKRKIVIELIDDPQIMSRLTKEGNHFYVSRFASDRMQLKGVTKVIRGPSVVVRLGDPGAPLKREFEGWESMPPDPRLAWNSVRASLCFTHVHGLSEGSFVMDRGQEVGVVEKIDSDADSDLVKVSVAFFETEERKCPYVREHTRYFINKAKLTTRGVEGDASTVLYGSYVVVIPDPYYPEAKASKTFIGERVSPPEHIPKLGEKQLALESKTWLPPDTPIFYRGDLAGYVHSVKQASDSNSFYAFVRIYPEAIPQVWEHTVFFLQGKLKAQLFRTKGLLEWEGPRFEIPDPQLLLRPAIEFRTPPNAAKPFTFDSPGKPSFLLHHEPKEEWLEWNSSIPFEEQLKKGATKEEVRFPRPVWSKFHWREAWKALVSWRKHEGYVLPISKGVIGPSNLLQPSVAESSIRKVTFEVGGLKRDRGSPVYIEIGADLRFMEFELEDSISRCPIEQLGSVTEPVDIWVVTDPEHPKAISASKLTQDGERWIVSQNAGYQQSWHGAPVVSREKNSLSFGKMIGIFLVGENGKSSTISLFPEDIRKKLE